MMFSDIQRTDETPKTPYESDYDFLDRSAYPPMGRVRALLEACLLGYPDSEKSELVARLMSPDSMAFRSASFELFLHEHLSRLGFVLEPHPNLPNNSRKRPDFLVMSPEDGSQFYLEAVCASDDDGRNEGAEARKALALHTLSCAEHPNFILEIHSSGDPATQPSGNKLTKEILHWLDSLSWDEVNFILSQGDIDPPEYGWEYEGWKLSIRAWPVKSEARGLKRRLIGSQLTGARVIDGWTPVRDALLKKSRRYGELSLPLVVAVNIDTYGLNDIDVNQALFGQEVFIFTPGWSEPRFAREKNGAWGSPDAPRGRRCSGAWLFSNLTPYRVAQHEQRLYLNPFATNPIPPTLSIAPLGVVEDGKMKKSPGGITLLEVFGLDESWPEYLELGSVDTHSESPPIL